MVIGVPKEIKSDEYRVGIVPAGVEMLVSRKHEVLIEKEAGLGSGIEDQDYKEVGAKMAAREEVFDKADMPAVVNCLGGEIEEFIVVDTGQYHNVYFYRVQTGFMGCFNTVEGVLKVAAPRDSPEFIGLERVQTDVYPVQAGLFKLVGVPGQPDAVGRQGDVVNRRDAGNHPY